MAIYTEVGAYNSIVGVLTPTPQLVSVVGNIYVADGGSGGSVSITSSDGTIGITGALNNFNIIVAPQGATAGQVLQYNGTKWVPQTVAVAQLQLTVDGVNVPPVNNTINFQDSQVQSNRILFSRNGNNINAVLDSVASVVTTELSILNLDGTQAISLDYPDNAAVSYELQLPPTQGGANQTLINDGNGRLFWGSSGGGGGGAFSSAVSVWTGGTANKQAYNSPGVINNVGITISLVASSGGGEITGARVSLGGATLPNTYATTGSTFPNYSLVIPPGDLAGQPAEINPSSLVSVTGVFNASNFNIANAGTLTTTQPAPFAVTLSASFVPNPVAFYNTVANVSYQYNVTSGIGRTYSGTIAGISAPSASGNINVNTGGGSFGGTVIGDGEFGAATNVTVPITGTLGPANLYIPAFYQLTTNSTAPVFTSGSVQTVAGAAGTLITFPVASASTNYAWIATTLPLARIQYVTSFGNAPFVPDITAPTQTISGQIFNVFGVTGTSTTSALQLQITAS